jgi:prefoldin subunit 5
MDLEIELKDRLKELHHQKQQGNQLVQKINQELIMIDGMISEVNNTLNKIILSKPKQEANQTPDENDGA